MENILRENHFNLFKNCKKIAKKKNCSIVNIGSIVGEKGLSELSGYGASKAALNGLTKCLMSEFSQNYKKIRINCLTRFCLRRSTKKFKKNKKLYNWTLSKTPLKRWANSIEISNLILFLLSENSTYINGSVHKYLM